MGYPGQEADESELAKMDAMIAHWRQRGGIGAKQALAQLEADRASAVARMEQVSRTQDPDKNTGFEYRNRAGAADEDINRYRGLGEEAANRKIKADYDQANQTRGYQGEALGLYRDAAMGKGPSAAQAQFQGSLDQSLRAGQATANSARGGALGLAQARLAAAREGGEMLSDATSKAAALRAQEMQAAMGGYAGLGTQMRGQDEGRSMYNADLALRDRTTNDQARIAYEGLGQGVAGMQQTGSLTREQVIGGQLAEAARTSDRAAAKRDADSTRALGQFQTAASVIPIAGGIASGAAGAAHASSQGSQTAGTPTDYTGSNAGSVATAGGLGGAATPKSTQVQSAGMGSPSAPPQAPKSPGPMGGGPEPMGYQVDPDKRPKRWG